MYMYLIYPSINLSTHLSSIYMILPTYLVCHSLSLLTDDKCSATLTHSLTHSFAH